MPLVADADAAAEHGTKPANGTTRMAFFWPGNFYLENYDVS